MNINQAILISLASEAIILSSVSHASSVQPVTTVKSLAGVIKRSPAAKLPVELSPAIVKQAMAEFFYKTPQQFLYEYHSIIADNADSTSASTVVNEQDRVKPCYVESYQPCCSNHSDCGRGTW